MRSCLRNLLAAAGVLIFGCVCVSFFACILSAFSPILTDNGGGKIEAAHLLKVSWFTFYQAVLSMCVACAVGIPLGFFCGRRKFFGRDFLLSLSSVPFCIPALIVALGYISFFGFSGTLNTVLKSIFSTENAPVTFLYSKTGLIIAQGFYNFPIVMKTVSDTFERIPNDKAEAARLLGASESRIFRTITLYQILPSIISSSIPVFIYCFMSFMLVLLFGAVGCTTLEVEIFQSRAAINFRNAGLFALAETTIAAVVVAAQSMAEQKSFRIRGIAADGRFIRKNPKGFVEISSLVFILVLIIIFFLCPLFGIFESAASSSIRTIGGKTAYSFQTFKNLVRFKSFFASLKWTFVTASCTGAVCSIMGFVYSVFLNENSILKRKNAKSNSLFLKILAMMPMAVSGVVIAFGISILVKKGNVALLIIAQSALGWPIAFKQIHAQVSKIPARTIEAAKLISKNNAEVIFRIYMPIAKRGILSAFCFCFSISAGDTTLPLVLSIPKFDMLALFTYRLAGAYRFHEACASGILLGAICIFFFAISMRVFEPKNRIQ